MGLVVIGISHKTADVAVRERFSFTKSKLMESLLEFKQSPSGGAVILSTCNRMEIYAYSSCNETIKKQIDRFIVKSFGIREDEKETCFYIREDMDAVNHLFRVACGLDSQVLGENQILGQVRSAWLVAKGLKVTDDFLDELFARAVKLGKAVRTQTGISYGNVSIGSVAMRVLKDRFKNLNDKRVLIIGTGKIGSLLSKYLKEEGIKGIFVSNRTYDKACRLAKECGGEAIHFDSIQNKLEVVDVVISSTASPHFVLRREVVEKGLKTRTKPLLLLDLAVPRDIEPVIEDIANIAMYDLDDLKSVVEKNYARREKEAARAGELVEKEVRQFMKEQRPDGRRQKAEGSRQRYSEKVKVESGREREK